MITTASVPAKLNNSGLFVVFLLWHVGYAQGGWKENFVYHEVTLPAIIHNRQKRDVSDIDKISNDGRLSVVFHGFERDFVVDLEVNSELFTKAYTETYYQEDGTAVTSTGKNAAGKNCFYTGKIRTILKSLVAVSTCAGLRGFLDDGKEVYFIEPITNLTSGEHYLFRQSDAKPSNVTECTSCAEELVLKEDAIDVTPDEHIQFLSNHRARRDVLGAESDSQTRYIELVFAADYSFMNKYGGDTHVASERLKELANEVNAVYRGLNIHVALVYLEMWSTRNMIRYTRDVDPENLLGTFKTYRKESICAKVPRHDIAILVSNEEFKGATVGKAYKRTVCSFEYSCGIAQFHSEKPLVSASTIAHEMGHVMGMDHDQILDGRGENCDCDDNTCIMSAVSTGSAPFVRWSRCSEKQLRDNYAREQDACLRERPDSLYMSPVCGNGFLEEGEKCDCGIVELCTNPCCNATTCQLQPHAECGAGSCCDLHTCQLRPASVVCRPARRSCDLAEYCTGSSELCPDDRRMRNGELCVNAGEAYCYEGECYSHQSQCRRLWGESHHNGDVECYDRNVNGAESGNCGQDRILNEFTACSDDDKMCGVLFCTEHGHSLSDSLPETLVGFPSLVRKSRIQMGAQRTTCLWANIDFGLIVRNYGHVPNGAKCGEDKMCVNHKCVSVAQVLQSETSSNAPCAEGCHGNGVCNNVGNCHCFDGYAPPYCQKPGAGGSPDSGPALDDKGSLTVLIAFLVLFLVVIPAILISMAIYYIKFGLPSWIPLLGKGSALGRNQPNIKPEETRKSSSWRNKMPKFGNIRDTSSPQVPSQQQVETPARPLPHTPSPRQLDSCKIADESDIPSNKFRNCKLAFQDKPPQAAVHVTKANLHGSNQANMNTSPRPAGSPRPAVRPPLRPTPAKADSEVVTKLKKFEDLEQTARGSSQSKATPKNKITGNAKTRTALKPPGSKTAFSANTRFK